MSAILSADAPQLELITNPQLIWQLQTHAHRLPMQYVWQAALMLTAQQRIASMHADYVSNGPPNARLL